MDDHEVIDDTVVVRVIGRPVEVRVVSIDSGNRIANECGGVARRQGARDACAVRIRVATFPAVKAFGVVKLNPLGEEFALQVVQAFGLLGIPVGARDAGQIDASAVVEVRSHYTDAITEDQAVVPVDVEVTGPKRVVVAGASGIRDLVVQRAAGGDGTHRVAVVVADGQLVGAGELKCHHEHLGDTDLAKASCLGALAHSVSLCKFLHALVVGDGIGAALFVLGVELLQPAIGHGLGFSGGCADRYTGGLSDDTIIARCNLIGELERRDRVDQRAAPQCLRACWCGVAGSDRRKRGDQHRCDHK